MTEAIRTLAARKARRVDFEMARDRLPVMPDLGDMMSTEPADFDFAEALEVAYQHR